MERAKMIAYNRLDSFAAHIVNRRRHGKRMPQGGRYEYAETEWRLTAYNRASRIFDREKKPSFGSSVLLLNGKEFANEGSLWE